MKINSKYLQQVILEETKKILEEELEEETGQDEEELEDEIDYDEDYERALSKIADCEKRVEYLTKRLKRCKEKQKDQSPALWSDLWQ